MTKDEAIAADWSFVLEQPATADQNTGKVTPPTYRAERFVNSSTLGEEADSMELLLTRIDLFEQQLTRNGVSSA